jgi:glycosyltransferase involved in cell wall biosynthesis
MSVAQICIGRFYYFDLARQLLARGMLAQFFTGYPTWKIRGEGLPKDKVTTFPWFQTPYMAMNKWGWGGEFLNMHLAWLAHQTLDRFAARHLPECDVLIALSGSGLHASRTAQSRGAQYVCDRGSSHIRFQEQILHEEFLRWGERFPGIDPRIIEKEEAEYEAADLITVPSTFVFNSFVEMGVPREKLRRIPYGVDLKRFEKVANPDPERFVVLFVGRVSLRKGVPDLLEAFDRLAHPRKELRFVGGIEPEMRRHFNKRGIGENVVFVGHLPQLKLKEEMSRANVMVLPSIEEGLAMVQAQALACGCPVIGTTNTGASDLFGDGVEGFIVPPRDPEALVGRLAELAESPLRRAEMGAAAIERVKMLGGWDSYGDEMVAVLHDLLEEGVLLNG